MAALGQRVVLGKGHTLHSVGDFINDVYLLESGLVSVSAQSADGHAPAKLAGPGDVIGLAACLQDEAVAGDAVVLMPATARRFSCVTVRGWAQNDLAFASYFLKVLSREVLELAQLALSNSRQADQRLAALLLEAARKAESQALTITQESLAQILSLQRTTVSAIASALGASGAIQQRRGTIKIVDESRLQRIALHGLKRSGIGWCGVDAHA